MDTSSKYLTMCERAKEIQNMWTEHEGDSFKCHFSNYADNSFSRHKRTWLPRQDQLQQMMTNTTTIELITIFYNFCKELSIKQKIFDSCIFTMEQAWIRLVMYKLYNKEWNDEKGNWIEIL